MGHKNPEQHNTPDATLLHSSRLVTWLGVPTQLRASTGPLVLVTIVLLALSPSLCQGLPTKGLLRSSPTSLQHFDAAFIQPALPKDGENATHTVVPAQSSDAR